MFNLYEKIRANAAFYRQFQSGDELITQFNCLLVNKYEDLCSQYNYFVYVVEGRKVWHTAHASYDLQKGDCIFVRKGACIVEQFFETTPCFIMFFMSDEFIRETLHNKALPSTAVHQEFDPVIPVDSNSIIQAFFDSMITYFDSKHDPDQAIIQLKFKELLLTISDNAANMELNSFFSFLLQYPRAVGIRQVMENNYCFNLSLEEFAQLSGRSLSGFKREFTEQYQTTPGKWLLERRLQHALHLITNADKSVGEAAFESGFENVSHFSRVFRHRFGTAPAHIRKQVIV